MARAAGNLRTIDEFLALERMGVIAHRGVAGLYPENTLVSFRAAVELGADMLELDVLPSADGELVVIHDATLQRTTDGVGAVMDHGLAELRELDAGSWFDARFAGERLPTLQEVLEELGERILVNIEIKDEAVTDQVEGGVADRVVRLVRRLDLVGRVIVSCFDPRAVAHARELEPRIHRASLYDVVRHAGMGPVEILAAVDSDVFSPSKRRVTAAMVSDCHAAGKKVSVYTVNEEEELQRMLSLGVDAIFTDRADRMLELLDSPEWP